MRNVCRIVGCLLLMVLTLVGCQSAKPIKRAADDSMMYAMIYDYENSPVSGVAVYLNGKKIVDSDIQGRFILDKAKKGEYSIKLVKKGYETLEETFEYNPLQVLYFKLASTGQLLSLAESALDGNEYAVAERCLNRALLVEPARPDVLFLKSICCYLQGRAAEAAAILESLAKSGSDDPSVNLLLEKIRQAPAEAEGE